MSESQPIVFVIDDDTAMRNALRSLIRWVGLQVELFGSTQEFQKRPPAAGPVCLVLDIRLPGKSGLDFQRELAGATQLHHLYYRTLRHPLSVRAMKAGAVEFLTVPFRDQDLPDAIQHPLERDRVQRKQESEVAALRRRVDTLTPSEREVFSRVITGRLNKVANDLGTSEITIKMHSASVMRKMQADHLADLLKMAARLDLLSASKT
jgi:FixJ family two-component response regulator